MQTLKTIFTKLTFYTSVLCVFLSVHGFALAKTKEEASAAADDGGGGSSNLWLLGYFIVGLGIVLGLLVLCRSARRSDRAKPQEYKGLTTNE